MSWDNVLAWWCHTLHGRPGTLKSILGWQMILWFLYGLQKIDCSTRRSLWGRVLCQLSFCELFAHCFWRLGEAVLNSNRFSVCLMDEWLLQCETIG